MAVQQSDIIDGGVAITNVERYKINAGAELEGTTTALTYSIGSGVGGTPLQIKSFGSSNTGWIDEQDIELFNQSFTGVIQVSTATSGVVGITTATLSVTNGTIIGIYGAGSWATQSATLNQIKGDFGSAGSNNAGIVMGGLTAATSESNITELFNGSAWVLTTVLPVSIADMGSGGSQNAAWVAGGVTGVGLTPQSSSQLYNGNSWVTSGVLSQSQSFMASAGGQHSALVVGGAQGTGTSTSTFNGSTWTSVSFPLVSVSSHSGTGSQMAAIIAGNNAGASTSAIFNGSSWNIAPNMNNVKYRATMGGTQNTAWSTGGVVGGTTLSATELFNGAVWIVSGSLNTTRQVLGGFGSPNAGSIWGGQNSSTGYFNSGELHTQTTYRPMTWENVRCATNVGIALGVSGSTCNVKLQGFAQNMSISSTAGNYYVITKNSSNTTTTASFQTFKTVADVEDWIIGTVGTVTTSLNTYNNPILAFDENKNWG